MLQDRVAEKLEMEVGSVIDRLLDMSELGELVYYQIVEKVLAEKLEFVRMRIEDLGD